MNSQLIEKVIKCNNELGPQFVYENPVLDKNIASVLSNSLVKILKVSSQNSSSNNNLRLSALENIRRLCRVESENHLKADENFTELLTQVYEKNIKETINASNSIERLIDAYFVRSLKDIETNPDIKSSINPETVQSLNNLNENGWHIETLWKEVIHWRSDNKRTFNVVKDMWNNSSEVVDFCMPNPTLDDIAIKMKSEIERILLENCCKCLENQDRNLACLFTTDEPLVHLLKTSAISQNCYQICYNILNDLFVKSNYDPAIQRFISAFVNYVKIHSNSVSFSSLYPSHLCNIVLLLDIDLNETPVEIRDHYIKTVLPHLVILHQNAENDLILMLSHFPIWFEIYFEQGERK